MPDSPRVEAAARALYERQRQHGDAPWPEIAKWMITDYRQDAEVALAAAEEAEPTLVKSAWKVAEEALVNAIRRAEERADRAERAARELAGALDDVASGLERGAAQASPSVRSLYLNPARKLREALSRHPEYDPTRTSAEATSQGPRHPQYDPRKDIEATPQGRPQRGEPVNEQLAAVDDQALEGES